MAGESSSYFFRVEHDLLRSEAFKTLSGSAIKVYLVLGLHADFGTGWAYPSIRTIAACAGLSRQTVLDAIAELADNGILVTRKSRGRATAYQLLRPGAFPPLPSAALGKSLRKDRSQPAVSGPAKSAEQSVPVSLGLASELSQFFADPKPGRAQNPDGASAQFFGLAGHESRPKREPITREESPSVAIPGTPIRVTADGRLVVAELELIALLAELGLPPRLAERIVSANATSDVSAVALNALYLRAQGKLVNPSGYIRAGVNERYTLMPQVAERVNRLRRDLERDARIDDDRRRRDEEDRSIAEEEARIQRFLAAIRPDHLDELVQQAIRVLPAPFIARNPTITNPFVRTKVYELAGGELGDVG